MIRRHNLRTVLLFILSLLLLPAYSILVSEKVPTSSEHLKTSMSLGFFSSSSSGGSTKLLFPTIPFSQNHAKNPETVTSYIYSRESPSSASESADFILTIIAIGFAFFILFPTYSIGVYLNSDVRSYDALSFAKKLSVFCAVVTCLFTFGLMLPLVVVSFVVEKDDDAKNMENIEWPWPILMVSFLLMTFVFVPWSIWRAKIIDDVRLDFPQENEENEVNEKEEHQMKENENEPTSNTTINKKSEKAPTQQSDRHLVYLEAASITFYKTRSSIGKLLLLLVCILSIFTAATVSSYSWFSSPTYTTVHSPLFGTCNIEYVTNFATSTSTSTSNVCMKQNQQESEFVSIYRGLNGTGLAFAVFLLIGAILQWTWCLVPLAFIACAFSCAVIGVGVEEMNDINSNKSPANCNEINLGWLFWLQVGTAIVWFIVGLSIIVIQLCVDDGTAGSGSRSDENDEQKKNEPTAVVNDDEKH